MSKTLALQGRSVLLTGASRGIGLEMARLLAAGGARLALAARNPLELHKVAAELRAAGAEAHAVSLDLCDDASVACGVTRARELLGGIDVLITEIGVYFEASRCARVLEAIDQAAIRYGVEAAQNWDWRTQDRKRALRWGPWLVGQLRKVLGGAYPPRETTCRRGG